MKKKIILILFLFTIICKAQNDHSSFLIQIPNDNFVPKISHSRNEKKINKTKTRIKKLNKLINSYKIYDIKKVFNTTKIESLKDIYLIECDDLTLMNTLSVNYIKYYPITFDLEGNDLENMFPLPALPNDYIKVEKHLEVDQGNSKGNTRVDQDELNYIRAPEAWQISKGSPDIIIGISDNSYNPEHEDLKNKITHVFGKNRPNSSAPHGSYVASAAAAETNNGKGMAAIGYKSHIYMATNSHIAGIDTLSKMKEVKVINTAWVTSASNSGVFEKAFERGKVIVAAAGNNGRKGPETYIYPAAFKNVISVSGIGHHDFKYLRNKKLMGVLKDTHETHRNIKNRQPWSHHHNDSVDIVAPSYGILLAKSKLNDKSTYANEGTGTSYAAPMVSGTIALMFDVNYCLDPKEIETILKLTAVKIDTLPYNKAFYGKLGAGKLDAYRAVKTAKDMADEFGTVEIKDRILYRWFYKLDSAPYNIKMTNNDVTGNARLKFKARNSITIKSGHYYPKAGGRLNLSIDKNLPLNDCSPRPNSKKASIPNSNKIKFDINNLLFEAYPASFDKYVTISKKEQNIEDMTSLFVYNVLGKIVHEEKNINASNIKMNLSHLQNGPYLAKIFNAKGINICVKEIFRN